MCACVWEREMRNKSRWRQRARKRESPMKAEGDKVGLLGSPCLSACYFFCSYLMAQSIQLESNVPNWQCMRTNHNYTVIQRHMPTYTDTNTQTITQPCRTHTHTHTHRHMQTHIHTHTHTHVTIQTHTTCQSILEWTQMDRCLRKAVFSY